VVVVQVTQQFSIKMLIYHTFLVMVVVVQVEAKVVVLKTHKSDLHQEVQAAVQDKVVLVVLPAPVADVYCQVSVVLERGMDILVMVVVLGDLEAMTVTAMVVRHGVLAVVAGELQAAVWEQRLYQEQAVVPITRVAPPELELQAAKPSI
jgi:hypothetical protein